MHYKSEELEMAAVLQTAQIMCAAARTAPKAKGVDHLHACVLTGDDKEALCREMERLSQEWETPFLARDAQNVRVAQAVVLIGTEEGPRGLNHRCLYCHFDSCKDCAEHGLCAFDAVDIGIAIGSAAAAAADHRVDNRILYSAGKAAISLGLFGESVKMAFGIPLSVSGKSPFFDR